MLRFPCLQGGAAWLNNQELLQGELRLSWASAPTHQHPLWRTLPLQATNLPLTGTSSGLAVTRWVRHTVLNCRTVEPCRTSGPCLLAVFGWLSLPHVLAPTSIPAVDALAPCCSQSSPLDGAPSLLPALQCLSSM